MFICVLEFVFLFIVVGVLPLDALMLFSLCGLFAFGFIKDCLLTSSSCLCVFYNNLFVSVVNKKTHRLLKKVMIKPLLFVTDVKGSAYIDNY